MVFTLQVKYILNWLITFPVSIYIYTRSAHSSCLAGKWISQMVPVYMAGAGRGGRQFPTRCWHATLTISINTWVFNLKDTLKLGLGHSISNLTLKWLIFSNWEGGRQSVKETKPIRNFLKLLNALNKQSTKMTMPKHCLKNSSSLRNPVPAWETLKSIMENVLGAPSGSLTR